jgi:hypothetical protein
MLEIRYYFRAREILQPFALLRAQDDVVGLKTIYNL